MTPPRPSGTTRRITADPAPADPPPGRRTASTVTPARWRTEARPPAQRATRTRDESRTAGAGGKTKPKAKPRRFTPRRAAEIEGPPARASPQATPPGWPAARHRAARMPEWTRRLTRELDTFAEQNATTTLPVPIALNQPPEPLRLGPSDDAEWAAFAAEAVLTRGRRHRPRRPQPGTPDPRRHRPHLERPGQRGRRRSGPRPRGRVRRPAPARPHLRTRRPRQPRHRPAPARHRPRQPALLRRRRLRTGLRARRRPPRRPADSPPTSPSSTPATPRTATECTAPARWPRPSPLRPGRRGRRTPAWPPPSTELPEATEIGRNARHALKLARDFADEPAERLRAVPLLEHQIVDHVYSYGIAAAETVPVALALATRGRRRDRRGGTRRRLPLPGRRLGPGPRRRADRRAGRRRRDPRRPGATPAAPCPAAHSPASPAPTWWNSPSSWQATTTGPARRMIRRMTPKGPQTTQTTRQTPASRSRTGSPAPSSARPSATRSAAPSRATPPSRSWSGTAAGSTASSARGTRGLAHRPPHRAVPQGRRPRHRRHPDDARAGPGLRRRSRDHLDAYADRRPPGPRPDDHTRAGSRSWRPRPSPSSGSSSRRSGWWPASTTAMSTRARRASATSSTAARRCTWPRSAWSTRPTRRAAYAEAARHRGRPPVVVRPGGGGGLRGGGRRGVRTGRDPGLGRRRLPRAWPRTAPARRSRRSAKWPPATGTSSPRCAPLREAVAPFDTVGPDYRAPSLGARRPSRLHSIEELPDRAGHVAGRPTATTAARSSASVNYGRDCDSIATMSGALAGALPAPAVPRGLAKQVAEASRLDLLGTGDDPDRP